ncbi:twin-arginine translocation signal domain-containing protein, partial [Pricia sp.]|uniref:twin-arginine translocation signal domain-containing protein n=1 Tax=Pricia sp. TaxID=2268138 RepID=UPI0035935CC4
MCSIQFALDWNIFQLPFNWVKMGNKIIPRNEPENVDLYVTSSCFNLKSRQMFKKSDYPSKSRRNFMKNTAIATAGISIVPRHVLGGPGFISPSDKLIVAG